MPTFRHRALLLAASATLLAAGCRERQVPAAPAVPPTSDARPAPAVGAAPLPAAELRAARADPSLCSLDRIDEAYAQGTLAVDRGRAVRLRGWFGTRAHQPAGEFRLVLAGTASAWALPAHTGEPRPDTAEYFQAPAMGTAGFDFEADLSAVPAGTAYRIVLLAPEGDASVACDTGRGLRLH